MGGRGGGGQRNWFFNKGIFSCQFYAPRLIWFYFFPYFYIAVIYKYRLTNREIIKPNKPFFLLNYVNTNNTFFSWKTHFRHENVSQECNFGRITTVQRTNASANLIKNNNKSFLTLFYFFIFERKILMLKITEIFKKKKYSLLLCVWPILGGFV